MTPDEMERAKQEALDLLMDPNVEDTIQLADKLLSNPWFVALGKLVDTVRGLREDVRYAGRDHRLIQQSEADIQATLNQIRKLAAFF